MTNKFKIIITIILLILVAFSIRNIISDNSTAPVIETEIEESGLPNGWSYSSDTDGVEIKLEKQSDQTVKPGIVLIKSDLPQNITPKNYVDKLINGAKATLTSFRVVQNIETDGFGYYLRSLQGNYLISQQQINLLQRIYVIDGQVFTLNASYLPSETNIETEIEQIFDSLIEPEISSS